MRAAHARFELFDHDAAEGVVAERVDDDGEPEAAAVADQQVALRVEETEGLTGLALTSLTLALPVTVTNQPFVAVQVSR